VSRKAGEGRFSPDLAVRADPDTGVPDEEDAENLI